jgi:hypothetical protein
MRKILLAVVLAATVATGALAAGQFTQDDQLFACAKDENGQLRLVAEDEACLPSETAVSWSAGGGAGGGTTFTTVTESVAITPGLVKATASCPAGSRVVGGGAQADPVEGGNVIATYPASDTAWSATVATNPAAQSVIVYAICAAQ